jgi:hypothetical protein
MKNFLVKSDIQFICETFSLIISEIDLLEYVRLIKLPLCQKRSTKYKKYVFMDTGAPYVYKGPYYLCERKFFREVTMGKVIDEISYICLLSPSTTKIVRILYCAENERYMIQYNAINMPKLPLTIWPFSTAIDENMSLVSAPMHTVAALEKQIELPAQLRINVLQHLYFRYILGLGDLGTHNLLVEDPTNQYFSKVYGFDFEEAGGPREPKSKFMCLEKKQHAFRLDIYLFYINYIRVLSTDEIKSLSNMFTFVSLDIAQIICRNNLFCMLPNI